MGKIRYHQTLVIMQSKFTVRLKNVHCPMLLLATAVKLIVASYNKLATMNVIGCLAVPHLRMALALMRTTPKVIPMACLLTLKETVTPLLNTIVNLKG